MLVFHLKLWWHIWRTEKPPSDSLVGCELTNSAVRNSTISRERTVNKRNAIYHPHTGANAKTRVKGAIFVVIARLQLISTQYGYGHKIVVLPRTKVTDRRRGRAKAANPVSEPPPGATIFTFSLPLTSQPLGLFSVQLPAHVTRAGIQRNSATAHQRNPCGGQEYEPQHRAEPSGNVTLDFVPLFGR